MTADKMIRRNATQRRRPTGSRGLAALTGATSTTQALKHHKNGIADRSKLEGGEDAYPIFENPHVNHLQLSVRNWFAEKQQRPGVGIPF